MRKDIMASLPGNWSSVPEGPNVYRTRITQNLKASEERNVCSSGHIALLRRKIADITDNHAENFLWRILVILVFDSVGLPPCEG
jgi:hypothetical protein